ncbi:DUF7696 family protein [Bosea sp. OAE752]|uniref:DUF7696 family protein n=1 Tax=Bosea sp. OAE752 TaxID=2663873 RepID=UPI003D22F8C8
MQPCRHTSQSAAPTYFSVLDGRKPDTNFEERRLACEARFLGDAASGTQRGARWRKGWNAIGNIRGDAAPAQLRAQIDRYAVLQPKN